MQEVFYWILKSSLKVVLFSKVFQTFKTFCSFDAPFGGILKKYRRFATIHYSLVAISTLFAELKQLKANCTSNRHTNIQTDTLTDYSNPVYAPTHSKVNKGWKLSFKNMPDMINIRSRRGCKDFITIFEKVSFVLIHVC